MPTHNPECTHGGAHSPSECRDRFARHLKPLETPDEAILDLAGAPEPNSASGLTDADREALRVALAGLAPLGADLVPKNVPAAT